MLINYKNKKMYLEGKEYIEIRNVDGVHLAYFKGEVLPALVESTVIQGADTSQPAEAVLKFIVKLEKLSK